MANTRKPVKPKAGAKPVADEVLSAGSGTGITVDDTLTDIIFPDDSDETDADETENEVSYTPTAEEIAAVLAYIKSQTVAEIVLEGNGIIVEPTDSFTLPGKPTKELFVKVYDVVDTITGTSLRPEDNGALTLSGRVTDADLDAAGVDKAWLLRIGAIVEAGYAGG